MSVEVRTAGLLRRGCAGLVDLAFALGLVAVLLMLEVLDPTFLRPPPDWFWTEWLLKHWLDSPDELLRPLAALLAIGISWTAAWEGVTGRTPGDRLLGLVVVARDGHDMVWWQAPLRAIGQLLEVGSVGLGWAWGFVSPTRRTVADYISGTLVIIAKKT